MERLTYKIAPEVVNHDAEDGANFQEIINKLGEYEDTGLTPAEIMDGKMLTGWIPVDEQLPELDEDGYAYVMVCMDDEFVATTDYTRDEGFGLWAGSGEITAWMPLPEPYKEDSL